MNINARKLFFMALYKREILPSKSKIQFPDLTKTDSLKILALWTEVSFPIDDLNLVETDRENEEKWR